ncbi:MAG: hypothetical protein K8S21_02305 [Gemmatimonadetes bacterium]|nr:hypothetical protein [Gemmatimonadota bacterium]
MLILLVAVAACHRTMGGPEAGATSSVAAVEQFLAAAKAQDLQAMSAVWGNVESPVRDRVDRQELERRLLIMTCHLRHDTSRIEAAQPAAAGKLTHRVDLTQGDKKASPVFTTVRNAKSGRWFVEDFDFQSMSSFCTAGNRAPPPVGSALSH